MMGARQLACSDSKLQKRHLGEGVPKDNAEAVKWWHLAAASGDTIAVKNKNIVAQKMTKEQIAEAQRLSTAFKPTKTP